MKRTIQTVALACLLPVLIPGLGVDTSLAQESNNHILFDDAIQNGWFNNPVNVTTSLENSSPVKKGSYSIRVNSNPSGAFQFNHPVTTIDTSPYKSLSFWIHGGTTGGQNLKVTMLDDQGEGPRWAIIPVPAADTWTFFSISLEDLGMSNTTKLNGLRIWESAGVACTYFLDDIQLSDLEVPSLAGMVYDDLVRGSWFNNPFGATVDLSNPDPVFNGQRSISTKITSGGGALQFNYTGGTFDTSPYHSVSFWIHGGTAGGQKVRLWILRNGEATPSWDIPALQANTWMRYTVPLNELNVFNATDVIAVRFRDADLGAQPEFFLDDIMFEKSLAFVLSYNGNGNTGGFPPTDENSPYTPGSSVTVLKNTGDLEKSGEYTFTGWNTSPAGNGTSYTPGDAFIINGNTTLYAQWSFSGSSYTVSYDGNGNTHGTIPTDNSNPYPSGLLVKVLANTGNLSKPGFVFSGWNTKPDGSGTGYNPSDEFTITSDTTLYASWTASPLTFSIFYNGNGNTTGTPPGDGNNPYPINSPITLHTGGDLAYSVYSFICWNTKSDGTGTNLYPGSIILLSTDLTLYARYGGNSSFLYPYQPYNEGKMDPQLTGWPLSAGEETYVLIPEFNRRPGSEQGKYLPAMWPVTPSAGYWSGTAWLDTHEKLVQTVKANQGPIDILLVGNSITQQWGSSLDNKPMNSAWQNYFSKYKAVNIGIGGDKIQNVLWRMDHGGVEGLFPRLVILNIGNNNMFFTPETGIDPVANGIKVCVENIRTRFPGAHVIVMKIFPAGDPSDRFYKDIVKTNLALDKVYLDSDPKVHVLNIWDDLANADGTVKQALFTSDKIHLSLEGYQVYASRLNPLVESILEGITDNPPVITSTHADQVLGSDSNCKAFLPDYTVDIEATDDHDNPGDLIITQSPSPSSPVTGPGNEVTLQVKDKVGNISNVTFRVSVIDNIPPAIISMPGTTSLTPNENGDTYLPNFKSLIQVNDNCSRPDEMIISQSPEPYTLVTDSIMQVTISVTDASQNSVQENFTVKLEKEMGMDALNKTGISVYPNPSEGSMHYKTNDLLITMLRITDISGRILMEKEPGKSEGVVNISHLNRGIYLLILNTLQKDYVIKISKI